ncbi:alkene reductase [Nocardia cyriacigeorgica]|uniref:alkene reductase n=1 Tax=Nocardia cyriacigeorgica TaxID=135487 RepID=UPI0018962483|nr:alkene reductase [Nocardia cyriacigeorgica]MBF6087344.1 alkene reductase [Nocardia cyriacigeorgica]MBF6092726.1 alkene reductase [Nocardia cyriacigeorgica]MBF6160026.1 alkene reductase [Nocardia cyriacigeorgica]MBF6199110.1 alkene reductase [Nocardia cyriacigeorgica]MBF6343477.1 alkene reductase [Nocardia cyriacigeorgica]
MNDLFAPYSLGAIDLANRIVMAPMTRSRRPDLVPDAATAEYYAQRAGAGLIITEGVFISPEAQGYGDVPGLWTEQQTAGWTGVTEAVHTAGGRIFAQLWHVGRVSHTSLQPDRQAPVGPSIIPANAQVWLSGAGMTDASAPRALGTEEISRVVTDFAAAAARAVHAGFDGVEVHGAHGFLLEQFLNPHVNDRADRYGGSVENRARFLLEVLDAVADQIGADRIGVRLSPFTTANDLPADNATPVMYRYLAAELSRRGLAYVHLSDLHLSGGPDIPESFLAEFRSGYRGTLLLAGGLDKQRAQRLLDAGRIDLAVFGKPFIANPDLVERMRHDLPLALPDPATFYGGDAAGYTDYPSAGRATVSAGVAG